MHTTITFQNPIKRVMEWQDFDQNDPNVSLQSDTSETFKIMTVHDTNCFWFRVVIINGLIKLIKVSLYPFIET